MKLKLFAEDAAVVIAIAVYFFFGIMMFASFAHGSSVPQPPYVYNHPYITQDYPDYYECEGEGSAKCVGRVIKVFNPMKRAVWVKFDCGREMLPVIPDFGISGRDEIVANIRSSERDLYSGQCQISGWRYQGTR